MLRIAAAHTKTQGRQLSNPLTAGAKTYHLECRDCFASWLMFYQTVKPSMKSALIQKLNKCKTRRWIFQTNANTILFSPLEKSTKYTERCIFNSTLQSLEVRRQFWQNKYDKPKKRTPEGQKSINFMFPPSQPISPKQNKRRATMKKQGEARGKLVHSQTHLTQTSIRCS